MSETESDVINLNDSEILNAIWIARKIANDKEKCFEAILGQVLEIMLKDKMDEKEKIKIEKRNGPGRTRPEFYVNKINYSWVIGKDKNDLSQFTSSDLCAATKLAMMQSKKTGRNFTFLFGIALEVIAGVKKEFGLGEFNSTEHHY